MHQWLVWLMRKISVVKSLDSSPDQQIKFPLYCRGSKFHSFCTVALYGNNQWCPCFSFFSLVSRPSLSGCFPDVVVKDKNYNVIAQNEPWSYSPWPITLLCAEFIPLCGCWVKFISSLCFSFLAASGVGLGFYASVTITFF
jgi:hypothetical protein